MKNLLFPMLSIIFLLTSCSKDGSEDILGGKNNTNSIKYAVNFNVKSAGFNINKTPLKSTSSGQKTFQYIVYNEDGAVYSDSIYFDDKVDALLNTNSEIPIKLQLPKGNYHLAILYVQDYLSRDLLAPDKSYRIVPKNFETDTYTNTNWYPRETERSNYGVYYQVLDLNVTSAQNNEQNEITLDPMWSEVKLTLTNIKSARIPIDVDFMQIMMLNKHFAFSVKTKLGNTNTGNDRFVYSYGVMPISYKNLPDSIVYGTFYTTKGVDNSFKFKVGYFRYTSPEKSFALLDSININIPNQYENGIRYNIRGDLKKIENLSNNSINITYGKLADDHIELPFN